MPGIWEEKPIVILALVPLKGVVSIDYFEQKILPFMQEAGNDIALDFETYCPKSKGNAPI